MTGIPAFVQSEGLHGVLILNGTIFNSPIGMGCSFNPELIEKMADIIATESRALGINQLFSPQVDLARELRFGRVEECFSEDSYLYDFYSWLAMIYANLIQCGRDGLQIRQGPSSWRSVGYGEALRKPHLTSITSPNK